MYQLGFARHAIPSSFCVNRSATGAATLKAYKGFPHGMPTTEAETINADLLAFIKG